MLFLPKRLTRILFPLYNQLVIGSVPRQRKSRKAQGLYTRGKGATAMLTATDVAMYFISKDVFGTVFGKNLIVRNGRRFYEGNARLNKYLHLAQNIRLAKTGEPLFVDAFYAYDNGAVIPEIQENYLLLTSDRTQKSRLAATEEEKAFLDKIYFVFRNADIDELIELSHEDDEWRDKSVFFRKEDQKMDSTKRVSEYGEQYADMLKIMDRCAL
jgi:uncharacterized phage-associated protein